MRLVFWLIVLLNVFTLPAQNKICGII